jgi:hypothetical protein
LTPTRGIRQKNTRLTTKMKWLTDHIAVSIP